MNQPPYTTLEKIGRELFRYDFITEGDIYYLDYQYFTEYLSKEFGEKAEDYIAYYRVPQNIYFDWEGNMISFAGLQTIYVEPDSVLGAKFYWNNTDIYDSFPPKNLYHSSSAMNYIDTASALHLPKFQIDRDMLLSYIHPLKEENGAMNIEFDEFGANEEIYDYEVFIMTNRRFISYIPMAQLEAINKNLAKADENLNIKVNIVICPGATSRPVRPESMQELFE
jgi:hypothetical protein